ncbi:hypothetical protein BLNAU_17103 [Blattamonas nauphoetae]|uniref:Uncharacterized protein n=1 Tax=Blattamonas nauphoetae TaxID=2049346 RepID=A0ABQ9XAT8_9EUKA|nr:hypothetical protein BLNAU_17103 [Blattamonas nauphoetae]
MYNVPTPLFPEMIHMFNAIPCPYEYDPKPTSLMMRSQNSIPLQGMIPRDVFTPWLRNDMHRYIHLSSPQFDPLNWFTQHATLDASQIVQIRTTVTMTKFMGLHLITPYNELLDAAQFGKGQNEVFLSAVENGLTLTQLRPIASRTINSQTVSFPKTKSSLVDVMSGRWNNETITIPDAVSSDTHEAQAYTPQWDYLFQCCLRKEALAGFSPPNDADDTLDTDEDFVTGEHRAHWARLQVVTSHLVVNIEQNAVFDSILVMFRYQKESNVLHSLGVFFVKNSTASKCEITDEGMQLMKRWCFILKTLYRLKRVQIFPSFIVVADSNNYPNFRLQNIQKLRSFIAGQNMWVAQLEAKQQIDVGDVGIPAMTASTTPVSARFIDLEVNHNPQAVRCGFCRSLVTENFAYHYCQAMSDNIPRIHLNLQLFDLIYSGQQKLQPGEEHIQIKRRNQGRLSFKSGRIVFQETQLSTGKTQKKDQLAKAKTVEVFGDIVSIESDIRHKKMNSGLWPTLRSASNETDFVRITCTSEIPGTPDFYRLPFPPYPSAMRGTTSTPHGATRRCVSTQQSSESPDDPSNIVEAHCLWSEGFKLSYEKVGRSQYKVMKLAEQPYQSLEFDVPSVDITNHNHKAQFMLPTGTKVGLGCIPVRPEQGTAYVQNKRIEYESFWQSRNRKNPPVGLDDALQADQTTLTERIQTCQNETEKSQLTCISAKGLLLRSRLSLQSGDITTAMSIFGESKQQMVLNDTAEVEYELIEGIRDYENKTMKSHPTSLEAKDLLLKSRISLQSGDIKAAILSFEQSKQHMELNGRAEVESESMLAHSSGPATSSHEFSELERVIVNARDCFGIDWEQWIREGQNLPILLNPSFHILQHHLRQVQDHVEALGSCLETFVVEIPATEGSSQDTPGSTNTDEQHTNEARRAEMVNTLLQALREGLSLQLRIAWRTGSRDEVHFFHYELSSINEILGCANIQPDPATFKSQTEQIEGLNINDVINAINDVISLTDHHYGVWHALVRGHQHSLNSAHPPSDIIEGTGNTDKASILGGNASISGPLPDPIPISKSVQHVIQMRAQFLVDRFSAIIATCHRKLHATDNDYMINDLYEAISILISLVTRISNLDANVGNTEDEISEAMMVELEEETDRHADAGAKFDEKKFGKQKRGEPTDLDEYGVTSKAEKRMQIPKQTNTRK